MECKIEGGQIVIRVDIDSISNAWDNLCINTNDPYMRKLFGPEPRIIDAKKFAPYLVSELNREDETGDTPLTMLLDIAIREAIENGADGVMEV